MEISDRQIEKAKKRFENFLLKKNLRKTAERFLVIDELCKQEEHVDVDSLFLTMRNKNISISRSTIYSTLDLLVECGIAVKHQFKDKVALYEQAITYQNHDHLVCNDCKKIKEFSDPAIKQIIEKIEQELGSNITKHSLVLYGDCTIPECVNRQAS